MPAKPPPINLRLSNARVDTRANIVRRVKYATNMEYRRKIVAANQRRREQYLLMRKGPWHERLDSICGPDGIDILKRFAGTRNTVGEKKSVFCFSSIEISGLLGRSPETITNWRSAGYMPPRDVAAHASNGVKSTFYSMGYVLRLARALTQTSTTKGTVSRRAGKRLRQLMDAG